MQFGAGFPLQALPGAAAIRDYAVALEQAGFDFTSTAGHTLGQPAGTYPDRATPQYTGPFNDPFVTFAYLAGVTSRIRFMSAILVLPALPTGLVAKQAAELSLISGGRFDLGVGVSWNAAEYRALGMDMRTRGARLEEQVALLRRLWSEPYVTFKGRFHDFDNIGLARAVAAPIPIWFGTGTDEHVLRRVARLADGWMTIGDFLPHVARFQQHLRDAGRDPAEFRRHPHNDWRAAHADARAGAGPRHRGPGCDQRKRQGAAPGSGPGQALKPARGIASLDPLRGPSPTSRVRREGRHTPSSN
jgi:probable F420-dependent oxidoreductase